MPFGIDGKPAPPDVAAGPMPMIKPFLADRTLFRGRLRAGYDALASQPEVDAGKLVAMGYCFGGHAALELARDKAPLAGVISFHGELDTPLPAGPGDIAGKVLVLTGDDDPIVPFEKVAGFREEMRAAGVDTALNEVGLPDAFLPHAERGQLLAESGLTASSIAADIAAQLAGTKQPAAKPARARTSR